MTSPQKMATNDITIGKIHTEVLEAIYEKLAAARNIDGKAESNDLAQKADCLDVCLDAVNEVNHKYGIEPLTYEAVRMHVELGEKLAITKEEFDMREVLTTRRAQEWWDRYSLEATVETAREVYETHCQLYGPPRAGSALDNIMQIVLSSAEFWLDYRGDEEPSYLPLALATGYKDYPQLVTTGWKERLIRFAVNVCVDAVAGGLAGAGAGAITGGAGAGVAAGVVGGLASHGADNILYGDD
jgi:hypothetical protein